MNTEEPVQAVEADEDKAVFYCSAVGAIPDEMVMPDSTKEIASCGHQVWMTPSTRNLRDTVRVPSEVKCTRCISLKELKELLGGSAFRTHPAAREELAKAVGEEKAEQVYQTLGITDLTEEEYDNLTEVKD